MFHQLKFGEGGSGSSAVIKPIAATAKQLPSDCALAATFRGKKSIESPPHAVFDSPERFGKVARTAERDLKGRKKGGREEGGKNKSGGRVSAINACMR